VTYSRDLEQPLQVAVQELIGRYLPDNSDLQAWRRGALEASDLFGSLETIESSFEQWLDAEGLAERIGTISYVAQLPDEERTAVLARVRALGEAQAEAPFPFRYRAIASVCYALS
jgi:hypothetical protein